MSGMFRGHYVMTNNFDQDIGNWDVSSVKDMSYMFSNSSFNQNIENWDVSSVETMAGMFSIEEASSEFNKDISRWDVSNVKDMSTMFYNGRHFNQDVGNWDVSNVTNMNGMFACTWNYTVFDQDIGNWDVSKVTNMSYMFYNSNFNQDISGWDVSNVINMHSMFASHKIQPEPKKYFNQDISDWNVSKVTSMNRMFYYAESFNQNLSGWCVANIASKPGEFDDGTDAWVLPRPVRSEEHTSELQSRGHLVCRLLLEKKTMKGHELSSAVPTLQPRPLPLTPIRRAPPPCTRRTPMLYTLLRHHLRLSSP